MPSNKGLSHVQQIILVLVFLFIMLLFLDPFLAWLEGRGSTASCKNWALLQSRTKISGVKVAELSSPCITTQEAFSGSTIELQEQVAEQLWTCWDQYGRGKVDFYSEWNWGFGDTHCRICSEVVIEQGPSSLDIEEFETYLGSYPAGPKKYATLFFETEDAEIDLGAESIPLRPGTRLFTAFVITKLDAIGELKRVSYEREVEQLKRVAGVSAIIGSVGLIGCGSLALTGPGAVFIPVCVKGALGVAAFGSAVYVSGRDAYFIPSLHLFSSDNVDHIKEVCGESEDHIYYKPVKHVDLNER